MTMANRYRWFIWLLIVSFSMTAGGLQWKETKIRDSFILCRFFPSYLRRGTNLKCSMEQNKMNILYNGYRLAENECKYQFQMLPWNCSRTSYIAAHAIPETAFLFAINSAGLAYALAYACYAGKTNECKCKQRNNNILKVEPGVEIKRDEKKKLILEDQQCTKHSLQYGIEESRRVLKNTYESDIRWRMDNHNKEAGRLALVNGPINRNKLCSCHGVSGACTISKCTLKLPRFSDVSDHIMEKYKSAVRMGSDNYGRLIPHEENLQKPTVNDLVYLLESPDFCKANPDYGILGTKGRKCNANGNGPESCSVLCCNRGYETIVEKKKERCNCRFKYCCKVTCQTCIKNVTKHVCK